MRTTVNHPAVRLRTRPIVPLVREEAPERRCLYCKARLWSGNPDPVCAPCQRAGREVPEVPDAEAPTCACGCGKQTLRAKNKGKRTGPYQKFLRGHVNYTRRKGAPVTDRAQQ